MMLKYDVETIEMDGETWYCLPDLHFADWLCFKNKYLLGASVNGAFFCKPIKETEKAMQFEVTKFDSKDNEFKLYHRWTFWSPKSAIGAMCF